jgi:hypothetical protein
LNARERVIQALRCRRPDRIPKTLAFFEQPLEAIAPKTASDYFDLDIRFAEFDPPDNQEGFLDYMDNLPEDIHVGHHAQLRIYHAQRTRQTGARLACPRIGRGRFTTPFRRPIV